MLKSLKEEVLEANLKLARYGLVTLTWGNVSGIDRNECLVVIKPSGVSYEKLKLEDLVVLDMKGSKVEGKLKPSSDTPTHLVLYREFKEVGGVVHTHSPWAAGWAQAGREIPALGTTHADNFYGAIPCTRNMTAEEIRIDYEKQTGNMIVETFMGKNPMHVPGILVFSHGPFCWGKNAGEAVDNAIVLEEVAKMAFRTFALNPEINPIDTCLLEKHFLRKHGSNAYYGQKLRGEDDK